MQMSFNDTRESRSLRNKIVLHRSHNLGISRAPLKTKRTRAPAYARALRRIKGVVKRVVHGKLRSDFQWVRGGIVVVKMGVSRNIPILIGRNYPLKLC